MPITELIQSIRSKSQDGDVLALCERTEQLLKTSLLMEKAIHEQIKILEKIIV